MSERLQNILWMAEEIDFELQPKSRDQAISAIEEFLVIAANPELSHRLYLA